MEPGSPTTQLHTPNFIRDKAKVSGRGALPVPQSFYESFSLFLSKQKYKGNIWLKWNVLFQLYWNILTILAQLKLLGKLDMNSLMVLIDLKLHFSTNKLFVEKCHPALFLSPNPPSLIHFLSSSTPDFLILLHSSTSCLPSSPSQGWSGGVGVLPLLTSHQ